MWVVYNKSNLKIIGLTSRFGTDSDKQTAIAEITKGTIKSGDQVEYDAIQVVDEKKTELYYNAFPNKLKIDNSTSELKLVIRDQEYFAIFVKVDAPDKHPVDGIPEIPADGVSYTVIILQKIDERKRLQTSENDNNLLYLRTDHGTIQDFTGKDAINSVNLVNGEAKIRLVSSQEKRVATIEILCKEPGIRGRTTRVEFI